jgi:hypothetical protein
MKFQLCAPIVLMVCSTAGLPAAVLSVTSLGNSGPGTLRDTVAASAAGDVIEFNVTGTIVFNSSITISHTLWVQGPGPAKLVVDANFVDRAFIITGGVPVVLSGMTIKNGLIVGPDGVDGGYFANGTDGLDAYGGGVLLNNPSINGSLTVSNCWFDHNTVIGGRGGRGGDNTPFANYPPGNGGNGGFAAGGAVYSFNGNLLSINCTFSHNQAVGGRGGDGGNNQNEPQTGGTGGMGGTAQSGAVDLSKITSVMPGFTNCTFSGNSVVGGVGGNGGTNNVTFPGGNGGAGGTGDSGAMDAFAFEMISGTVVSNSATGGAGGAGGAGFPPGLSGNTGPGTVGGIRAYLITCNGGVLIGNTILADNMASTSYTNGYFKFLDLGFNYFGDNDYLPCAGPGSRIGTVASPLHAQLGPLAQNGSGLPTHAPLTNSPVIDSGYSFGTTADERRAPRPVGVAVAGSGGDGSDVGAFEFGSTPLGQGQGGDGSKLVLTWPACYGDFTLQSTTNLLAPNGWISVTDTPVVVGNLFNVTNNKTGAGRFYRLINH